MSKTLSSRISHPRFNLCGRQLPTDQRRSSCDTKLRWLNQSRTQNQHPAPTPNHPTNSWLVRFAGRTVCHQVGACCPGRPGEAQPGIFEGWT